MRASALCVLLSCLASAALAVHRPLHRHRHDKAKRTEVLVVEEDVTVEVIDETIYLPGPPPGASERHQEGGKEEHENKKIALTTSTLPDGSVTVFPGPKPTSWKSRHPAGRGKLHTSPSDAQTTGVDSGAGETPPSNPATSFTAGSSVSDLGSSILSGEGGTSPGSATLSTGSSISLWNSVPRDASTAAATSPTTTNTPASSIVPTNHSPTSTAATSAPTPSHSGAHPFGALVAFGDNLSDNGNGSYAHNVAWKSPTDVVDGNKIYGAGTWTNGPVAVSYLTDLLNVPLTQNFAFGHAWGGSRFGATIDDTMQQSNFSASLADGPWFSHGEFSSPCWGAPSAKVQIADYISHGVNKDALHFLWIGANDMDAAYKGTLGLDDPFLNDEFAKNISTKIPALATTLLDAGAPYILVANLYPKHLAPLWPNFLGITTPTQWAALGAAISSANDALHTALTALPNPQYRKRIIHYDAFTFLSTLYAHPGSAFPNIKDANGWPSFCDGDGEETPYVQSINGTRVDGVEVTDNWDYCVTLGHQDEWFWMQYLDPTSHVHRLVAADMEKTVRGFSFGA